MGFGCNHLNRIEVAVTTPSLRREDYPQYMKKPPFFSIVVPVYDRPNLLREALDSIAEQTFQDFEVLVVDDGSSDSEVGEVGRDWSGKSESHRFFRLDANQGVSEARNFAIERACGEYVVFLDSDDLFLPWGLECFEQVIRKTRNRIVVSKSIGKSEQSDYEKGQLSYTQFDDFLAYRRQEKRWWFNPSGVAIKRETLIERGSFWTGREYCEDLDLWLRLGDVAGFVRIEEPHTYVYRLHDGNLHTEAIRLHSGHVKIAENERKGVYPGGRSRRGEREAVVAAHLRVHARELVRDGFLSEAWRVFNLSLLMNLKRSKWLFVLGFPVFFFLKRAGVSMP